MSYPHSRIIFIHAFTLTYISSESNIIDCDKTLVPYSVTFTYISYFLGDIECKGRIKMLNIYLSTDIFVTFFTEKHVIDT